jgi:hypothetical protein
MTMEAAPPSIHDSPGQPDASSEPPQNSPVSLIDPTPSSCSSTLPQIPEQLSSTGGALSDFTLRPFSYAVLGSISLACLQFL